jgi:hypothetical protein
VIGRETSKFVPFAYYDLDNQIKQNEMYETCNMHERRKLHTKFGFENTKGRDHLGILGVVWRIILKWISNKMAVMMDWIHLAQERVQWWALVNTVLNLPAHFLTSLVNITFSRRTLLHRVSYSGTDGVNWKSVNSPSPSP